VGITPFLAILHHELRHSNADFALIWSVKNLPSAFAWETLLQLARTYPDRFKIQLIDTSQRDRLNRTDIFHISIDVRDRMVMGCGPGEFRQHAQSLLEQSGVKIALRFAEEHFEPYAPPPPRQPVPGQVTWVPTGKVIASSGEKTILALLENAQIPLSASCRMGDCGKCRVRVTSGETTATGIVLACQAYPVGDVGITSIENVANP
jgi:NADH oxidoreductase Hcr